MANCSLGVRPRALAVVSSSCHSRQAASHHSLLKGSSVASALIWLAIAPAAKMSSRVTFPLVPAQRMSTRGASATALGDGLAVDGGADQRAFGQPGVGEGLGAVGGGEQHRLAENLVGRVVERRVAKIKPFDDLAAPLAAEEDFVAVAMFIDVVGGFGEGFVDFEAGDDAFRAACQGLADGRRGT